jgi:glycosyltransferase involved in cell wall biosynthesis
MSQVLENVPEPREDRALPPPPAAPELSVVIPVFNERENLRPLLAEIEAALGPTGRRFEVVVVDDASTDGSTALLRELVGEKPYLRVLFFGYNCGQTAAFDAGFRHASGALVATMDADLQNDPRDIPRLIAAMEQGGYDFVTGWRRNRRDNALLRTIPSRIANRIIRRVTGATVHDLGCSLKLYKKSITDRLRLYGEMHRFISVLVAGHGARVGEIEVNHRPRHAGRSKYGLSRTVKVLLDLLTVWFMRNYQTKPIYIFGGIGVSLFTLGCLLCVYVLYEKLFLGIWVHDEPWFQVALMFLVMGVQFVVLGLIAEVMVRTYFESQDKTAYLIADRAGFDRDGEGVRDASS